MLKPPSEDLERRRRLWVHLASPLFDFWLDTEPADHDFRALGEVVRQLGYTPEEVKAIYWQEVVPAVMGKWGRIESMDAAWLEQRILRRARVGYLLSWIFRPWWGFVACSYWRKISTVLDRTTP